jgi:uncharacterized membrane protein YfcA
MNPDTPLFPIAVYWAHIQKLNFHDPLAGVILVGFLVGILVGFFGIAGRFLLPPFLNIFFSFPYNVAVGSDLGQMLGTSTLNLMKFKGLHNVDYKLGGFMLIGTVAGVEGGAQIMEWLKRSGHFVVMGRPVQYLDLVLTIFYVALLLWIGLVVYREARGTSGGEGEGGFFPAEPTALTAKLQLLRLPPMISLPVSGIESISLWIIILAGLITGLLVGLLGVGGAFIRLPAFIYLIGCPMVVAIGTDFFENLFSMGYGTLTHSMKGNVDTLLVLVLLVTVVLGSQIGIGLARRIHQIKIRVGFAYIAFVAVLLMFLKLLWL